ncbi:MAG TPA: alkaline phosphatase PhoX, partial [Ilumatobacteraceae bacterium]|nr:alkaline phosphatase PhoX [Ilumatobacteraceae bacterium]
MMHDTDDIPSNPTTNPHLIDLIDARLSRRTVIGGAMAAGVGVFLGGGLASGSSLAAPGAPTALRTPAANRPSTGSGHGKRRGLLGFDEVPVSDADTITVPPGYAWDVLIPWGTPLTSTTAAFAEDASNTSQDQEHQVGFNHDGMHYFPLSHGHRGNRRGLLVLNHEYTDASQIYSAAAGATITPDAAGREKVAKALAGHGVTVVEIERGRDGGWEHKVDSRYNRRVTGTTPMR